MTDPADALTTVVIVVVIALIVPLLIGLTVTANIRRWRRGRTHRPPTTTPSRPAHASTTTAPPRSVQPDPAAPTPAPLARATPAAAPRTTPPPPHDVACDDSSDTAPGAGLPGPSAAAQIVTRTGPNTSGAALVDPYATTHRPWTPAEDDQLRTLYYSGLRVAGVAQTMRIDQRQVAIRLITLLLAPQGPMDNDDQMPNARARYTPDELDDLTTRYLAGDSLRSIADRAGRSQLGIGWRLLDLGTPRTTRPPDGS